ncbi:hypothetical protein D3C85_1870900 [compost metagenome]
MRTRLRAYGMKFGPYATMLTQSRRETAYTNSRSAPARLIAKNDAGSTLRPSRSLTSHWTMNRPDQST